MDGLSNLAAVVGHSEATLMVLDPPALVLTRIWCLYGEDGGGHTGHLMPLDIVF